MTSCWIVFANGLMCADLLMKDGINNVGTMARRRMGVRPMKLNCVARLDVAENT